MITVYEYLGLVIMVLANIVVVTMCVDANNKWRLLKAEVRRNLKPEAPSEAQ